MKLKRRKINAFFEDTLFAKPRNPRWSWGATDENERVFLRVWQDNIKDFDDGKFIRIVSGLANKSAGLAERKRHIDQIKNGTDAFGVLCVADDVGKKPRNIASFDQLTLLRLGEIREIGGETYVRIVETVPVNEVVASHNRRAVISKDVVAIVESNLKATTKARLIDARIGQGKFRDEVLQLWGNQCAVTGSTTVDAIRASHIKPWSESDHAARLNPHNGLPLIANLDALFDRGLISFEDDGKMIVSPQLTTAERQILGIGEKALSKPLSPEMIEFLADHRNKWKAKLS